MILWHGGARGGDLDGWTSRSRLNGINWNVTEGWTRKAAGAHEPRPGLQTHLFG